MTAAPVRQQWIAMLAKLVQPSDPAAAQQALAAMLPMLCDLPDQAFTLASLEQVALSCRRLPSYGELRSALGVWWQAHKPPLPALPAAESNAERWDRRMDEQRREWDDPAGIRARVAMLAKDGACHPASRGLLYGLIRKHAPQHLQLVPPSWEPREARR